MSYCVNCGVELEETEKKCVLCGCEVYNPKQPVNKEKMRPYPENIDELTKKANKRFTALILSFLFILPAMICLFLNLIYFNNLLWSVYVIGGFAFLWTCIVPPLINRKMNTMVFIFFDFVAAILLTLVIEIMMNQGKWFLDLGLPILLALWILIEIIVYLYQKKKIYGFKIPAWGLIFVGVFCVCIDFVIGLHYLEIAKLSWSVFVLIPSFVLATLFFIVENNHAFKDELIKRFHY